MASSTLHAGKPSRRTSAGNKWQVPIVPRLAKIQKPNCNGMHGYDSDTNDMSRYRPDDNGYASSCVPVVHAVSDSELYISASVR